MFLADPMCLTAYSMRLSSHFCSEKRMNAAVMGTRATRLPQRRGARRAARRKRLEGSETALRPSASSASLRVIEQAAGLTAISTNLSSHFYFEKRMKYAVAVIRARYLPQSRGARKAARKKRREDKESPLRPSAYSAPLRLIGEPAGLAA
jgi:hypothetical protein